MCDDQIKKNEEELLMTLMESARRAGAVAEKERFLHILLKEVDKLEKSDDPANAKVKEVLLSILHQIQ